MTNRSRTLYIGMTNDLRRRVLEHKSHTVKGFTKSYRIDRLLYFEETTSVNTAIAREKQLKRWSREKKIALIERKNPDWSDLAANIDVTF